MVNANEVLVCGFSEWWLTICRGRIFRKIFNPDSKLWTLWQTKRANIQTSIWSALDAWPIVEQVNRVYNFNVPSFQCLGAYQQLGSFNCEGLLLFFFGRIHEWARKWLQFYLSGLLLANQDDFISKRYHENLFIVCNSANAQASILTKWMTILSVLRVICLLF